MLYKEILKSGSVDFIDTTEMTRDEWLSLRTSVIGGSDAGAILGLNRYSTPLSVYLSKKDLARFEGNAATEWGNILEDPVRQKAKEDLGITIESVPGMFISKDFNYLGANFDGLVYLEEPQEIAGVTVSGLGGHEIKTSRTGDGFTYDDVPEHYYSQVQHYMAITGLPFFILTVFIFDKYEERHYVIERNDLFISNLIEKLGDFWNNHILMNVAPAPTGNEHESNLLKSLDFDEIIELPSECEFLLEKREEIESQIKELEKQSEAIKSQILLRMSELSSSDSDRTTATAGAYKITYNKQSRTSVDSSALKKAGLFDQYAKTSSYKVMRISRSN